MFNCFNVFALLKKVYFCSKYYCKYLYLTDNTTVLFRDINLKFKTLATGVFFSINIYIKIKTCYQLNINFILK